MKIMHTSDWHLGKRLGDKIRLDEQSGCLDEIIDIAARESVDVVIVAGDIYDTYNPSADAESLFYTKAVALARNRIMIAVSGNHDDPSRLSAPDRLAEANNIILYGGGDLSHIKMAGVTCCKSGVKIERKGEKVNIALLPFPSETRVGERFESYTQMVQTLFGRAAECFGEGYNIAVGHIFMTGGENSGSDEKSLGNAVLVGREVVPQCDYCALGHVHKMMTVSKKRNIVYSGSILNYHFDDTAPKSVVIIDTKEKSYKTVPITSGKKLVRINADSFIDAEQKLKDAGDVYAELVYSGAPMAPSEYASLRKTDKLIKITVTASGREDRQIKGRIELAPRDLFNRYYVHKKNAQPPQSLVDLFMSYLEDNK